MKKKLDFKMAVDDYKALQRLKAMPEFQVLMGCWQAQGREIIEEAKKAARRGNETSWRFYAGQVEGFEKAVNQVDRAILHLETELANEQDKIDVDQMIASIKGEKK